MGQKPQGISILISPLIDGLSGHSRQGSHWIWSHRPVLVLAMPVGGSFHTALSTFDPIAIGWHWGPYLRSCQSGWVSLNKTLGLGNMWQRQSLKSYFHFPVIFRSPASKAAADLDSYKAVWLRYHRVWWFSCFSTQMDAVLAGGNIPHPATQTTDGRELSISAANSDLSATAGYEHLYNLSSRPLQQRKRIHTGLLGFTHANFILLGREMHLLPWSFQKDFLRPTILIPWSLLYSLSPLILREGHNAHCFSFSHKSTFCINRIALCNHSVPRK